VRLPADFAGGFGGMAWRACINLPIKSSGLNRPISRELSHFAS